MATKIIQKVTYDKLQLGSRKITYLSSSLLNGFYDTHYQKGWKNLITTSLNTVIQPRGNPGLFFCPFIGLAGTKI